MTAVATGQTPAGRVLSLEPVWQFDESIAVVRSVPGLPGQRLAASDSGKIWLLRENSGRAEVLLSLGLNTTGDLGLSDLVFHPDFPQNNRIFVATAEQRGLADPATRVALWRWVRDGATGVALRGERTLFSVPAPTIWRLQARLAFDQHGALVTALGDGGSTARALNSPGSWRGKVLRLDIDASAPGQPFLFAAASEGSGKTATAVLASGVRAPAGLTGGAPLGIWLLDHWPNRSAALFSVTRGAHFGWPCRYGERRLHELASCDGVGFTKPRWRSGSLNRPFVPANMVAYRPETTETRNLLNHTLLFADPVQSRIIHYTPFAPRELSGEYGRATVGVLHVDAGVLYGMQPQKSQLSRLPGVKADSGDNELGQ